MSKQKFHGSDLASVAKHYKINSETIINFAGNVNPIGTSKKCLDTLSQHLSIACEYPDRNYTKLKQAISDYCNVQTHKILIGNGSTELISLGIKHIGASKALIIGPTYSEYKRELELLGCSLDEFTLSCKDDFTLHIPALVNTLANGYNFLIICNPNNPTGSILNQNMLEEVLQQCKKLGVFVMIDETYIEFSSNITNTTAIPLCNTYNNLLVLRGYSKFFAAPGIRLGYGITSNVRLIENITIHQNPWSVSSYAEFLGTLLIKDAEYITNTKKLITIERRKFEAAFIQNKNFKLYTSDANFFLIEILNPQISSLDVFEHCIKKGLFIRDCNSFFQGDGEFIRFCIMLPEDNDKLITTLNTDF